MKLKNSNCKPFVLSILMAFLLLVVNATGYALAASPEDVVINEIMQNPSAVEDSDGEWFELYNPTASDVDVNGWTIHDNDYDSHTIDNSGPLVIPAGGYLVLGNNSDASTNGGVSVDYVFPSNWYLSNSSDEVILLDDAFNEIDRVEYDDGATFPDPNGASIMLIDPTLDNNIGTNWCEASTPFGDGDLGTPGMANDCPITIPEVVVNEIMQNPSAVADQAGEWLEIYNPTATDIDIDGWTIKDNDTDSHTIENGGPLVISAGGYLVLGNNGDTGTNGGVTVDYVYGSEWYLGNSADEVVLFDGSMNEVDRVEYDDGATFPDPNGVSMMLIDPALDNNLGENWEETPEGLTYGDGDRGTPGCENSGCPVAYTPIYDIQFTADPSGDSPYKGQIVTTQGVVTAFFYDGGNRYTFIQDGSGPWSGMLLYKPDGFVNVGDLLEVTGEVSEYYGLTEIAYGTVFVLSSGNPLPNPESLPAINIPQEQWESVLVRADLADVVNPDLGFGEWLVDNCSGSVVVDDMGSYSYVPAVGDLLNYVQGPLNFSYGSYKIEPRNDGDISLGTEVTPIYTIQGSGMASPLDGENVVTEGVVVGDFQEYGQLGGFHIQDALGDGDPGSSDGIFVYHYSTAVEVGDHVRVSGTVDEYWDLTEITNVNHVVNCSSGNVVSATPIYLPVSDVADFEPFEGMLVTFPQELTISEYYNFDRYGEIVLTLGRQYQPTALFNPGSPEAAQLAQDNLLSRITLDDGRTSQNPDPAFHPNGEVFDLNNLFRGGDLVTSLTGALDYAFSLYRVQPTQGAVYEPANPRSAASEDTGGGLKVAAFNVLNYFTTLGSRGADTPEEFERQRDKIFAALAAIDADVVGLIEIENNGTAVADFVDGLNSVVGSGTYDYVNTGVVGSDEIMQAFIYKPGSVSLIGSYAILDDASFTDPLGYGEQKSRPALAQTFMDNTTGGVFTAVINHLKSKSSSCGPEDDDPEAGYCNLTRALGAQALLDWLASDPTGSGDQDFLILGDLNSYDKEDPIDVLMAGGYTDLIHSYKGEMAYSYVFNGQLGYLDYALANQGLVGEVTGTTVWHINADEPDLIDYDMTYKQDPQDEIYAPDAYRSSDHDPVITGLEVCDEIPPTLEVTVTPDKLWPVNHKYVDVLATVTASDNFDPNPTVALVSVTSNQPDDGFGDGRNEGDIIIVDDFTFMLRAERSGKDQDRVYTITYMVTDACGNSTMASASVTVPHDMGKK